MSDINIIYHRILNSRLPAEKRITALTELYNLHLPFRLDERLPEYLIESIIADAFIDFYQNYSYLLEFVNQNTRDLNILSRILTGLSHCYLPSCRFSTPVSDVKMLENIGAHMKFESRKFNKAFLFVKRVLMT